MTTSLCEVDESILSGRRRHHSWAPSTHDNSQSNNTNENYEMRLYHRTNYWGTTIESSNRDNAVDIDAIWVQAVSRPFPCCRGFGKRNTRVTTDDLQSEHDGMWNLFYVSGTEGRNPNHYFEKLVLIPRGERGYGKDRCRREFGWIFKGQWHCSEGESGLNELLGEFKKKDGYRFVHVHVGIRLDSFEAGKGVQY
jgi:hypothetical protein